MFNYRVVKSQSVDGTLAEEAEEPLVEGTVEISANDKAVVEEFVVEDTANKKLEVNKILFKGAL